MTIGIIVIIALFAFVTWYRLELGLALLFFLLPTYLIRFSLGPLPTTLLEVMIGIVIIIWLKKHKLFGIRYSLFVIRQSPIFFLYVGLFLLAATISVFTSLDTRAALGEWKAFYVEPILLFFILLSTINNEQLTMSNKKIVNCPPRPTSERVEAGQLLIVNRLLFALILSGLLTSLLAIYQHFTGFLVPWAFWENGNSYRVTAWYGFPNAVGLFLAPLIPLALHTLYRSFATIKQKGYPLSAIRSSALSSLPKGYPLSVFISSLLFLISAPFAILSAKSTGGLVGVAAGIGLLLLMYKKTRWWTIGIGLVGLVSIASLADLQPIKQELLLQDRSGQIRIAIWKETTQLLRDRPILGAGLASYEERIVPYHTLVHGEKIEIFHHPHNIFLAMYVNLGLLGLITFVGIIVWFYYTGFRMSKEQLAMNGQLPQFPYFLLSSMTVILVHGLVDSPYIKNDLAIFFWFLIATLFICQKKNSHTWPSSNEIGLAGPIRKA